MHSGEAVGGMPMVEVGMEGNGPERQGDERIWSSSPLGEQEGKKDVAY